MAEEGPSMNDLFMLLLTFVFFAASWAYVLACGRLDQSVREDES